MGFAVCFSFAKPIYAFLTEPLAKALVGRPNNHLIYTAIYETFFTYVKVGMFGGLCLAFPVIAAQIWLFVAPGLYRHERNAFLPFLIASPVLFIAGGAFVFYVMLPFAIKFFVGYQTQSTGNHARHRAAGQGQRLSRFRDDADLRLRPHLPDAGAAVAAGRVGIVTVAMLRKLRRYAIVAIFAVAAIFTPPDLFSMVSLAIPLVALYEVSIALVWLIERDRARASTADDL